MKKIKTLKDIKRITEEGIDKEIIKEIGLTFFEAWQNLSNDNEELMEFSLENHGYIVLIEEDDNIRDFEEVGLNKEDEGLLGVVPEWIVASSGE
jgi:hypothetical protein